MVTIVLMGSNTPLVLKLVLEMEIWSSRRPSIYHVRVIYCSLDKKGMALLFEDQFENEFQNQAEIELRTLEMVFF